jgi:predicted NUDIX family NTP pyrophosphohydrolase
VLAFAFATVTAAAQTTGETAAHDFFRVSLDHSFPRPVSGRLLLFIAPKAADAKDEASVDMNEMSPASVYVVAKEVPHLAPGESVDIDADDIVFPGPVSRAPAGSYRLQAVLDVDHNYNYQGRVPGDIISAPVNVNVPLGPTPAVTLSQTVPEPPDPLAQRPDVDAALKPLDMISPVLSSYWGRQIHVRGWVLLPPGYAAHPKDHYPTVYFTHGFGGTLAGLRGRYGPILYDRMKQGRMPEMIWVLLDESSPTGTHEFADSVNNGPWGTALTTECIPAIERQYRMDARPSGRFLQGHSSGGWATLWLQTRYPKIFGGTWSTSPDPSDFHFFSTVDIYTANANMYRSPDGTPAPMIRVHGKPQTTMQQLAQLEAVVGPYGGQLASFEWVFSPRGPDGRPAPLFDRATGDTMTLSNDSTATGKPSAQTCRARFTSSWAQTTPSTWMEPRTVCNLPSTTLAVRRSSPSYQAVPTSTYIKPETIASPSSTASRPRCIPWPGRMCTPTNMSSGMAKRSAGLLMYRRRNHELQVFLVHPGGPFWAKKDMGAWSISKGEYIEGEIPLQAAKREFQEETGFAAQGTFLELGAVQQSGGKVVSAWAFEGDCDPAVLVSNRCQIEWAPRSGRMIEIPEVDRAGWFSIAESRERILKSQAPFLDRLCQMLQCVE